MKGDPDAASGDGSTASVFSMRRSCTQCDQLRQENSSLSSSLAELRRDVAAYRQASNDLQTRNLELSMEVAELQCRLRTTNQRLLSVASVAQSMATQGQLLSNLLNGNNELHRMDYPTAAAADEPSEPANASEPAEHHNNDVLTISDTDAESEHENVSHGASSAEDHHRVALTPHSPDVKVSKDDASEIKSLLEAYQANRVDARLEQLIRRIIRALFTTNELTHTTWFGRATLNGPNRPEADPAKKMAIINYMRNTGLPCDNAILARCYRGITCLQRRSARVHKAKRT